MVVHPRFRPGCRLGLLINFGVHGLESGFRRVVNGLDE